MRTKRFLYFLVLMVSCTNSDDETPPLPPTNLSGIAFSTDRIDLTWTDNSTNETGFKIERKTGTNTYSQIADVGINQTSYIDIGLINNTSYSYRVYAYNSAGNSLTYSNEVVITSKAWAQVSTTDPPLSIGPTNATIEWEVTDDGGSEISSRGVCWGTNSNPTIALSSKTNEGTGMGIFQSDITSLASNTNYFVRAYATNSLGTTYGNEITFKTTECTSTVPAFKLNAVDQNQLIIDVETIETYLSSNGITNATKDPTGVYYTIQDLGTGSKPCLESYITVKYTGKLLNNGTIFDNITSQVTFRLDALILGWQIVLPKIQVGSKFTIYNPSGYAYGSTGSGGKIPPNANLIWEIELIE